jgi:hypothetical protein
MANSVADLLFAGGRAHGRCTRGGELADDAVGGAIRSAVVDVGG